MFVKAPEAMTAEEYRLVEAVAGVQAEKAEGRRIPEFATILEASVRARTLSTTEVLDVARRLERTGVLEIRRGMNWELVGVREQSAGVKRENIVNEKRDMLKGQIIGNVGSDAEVRSLGGKEYWQVQVAHRRRKEDPAEWVRVMARKNGEGLGQLLRKGATLYAAGDLRCTWYVKRDGSMEMDVTIWADEVQVMRRAQTAPKSQQPVEDMPY